MFCVDRTLVSGGYTFFVGVEGTFLGVFVGMRPGGRMGDGINKGFVVFLCGPYTF